MRRVNVEHMEKFPVKYAWVCVDAGDGKDDASYGWTHRTYGKAAKHSSACLGQDDAGRVQLES